MKGSPALTRDRYRHMLGYFNGLIREKRRIDYLVMPELSIPERWFTRFASKLARRGISLIGGVEHIVPGSSAQSAVARNQVWANLVWSDGFRWHDVLYKQDKQAPAIFERELLSGEGITLVPEIARSHPRVVVNSGFHFGILVCSEFTNIEHRASFRGNVDAVFVPEFNPDVTSFSSMVESAALDVHCYVVQCNDRQYGDSRIQAPYVKRHLRELLRVRGGVTDVALVGSIDVLGLRRAQSTNPPTTGAGAVFKPYLDGFEVHPRRWRDPSGPDGYDFFEFL
jgi:hypothetical protein